VSADVYLDTEERRDKSPNLCAHHIKNAVIVVLMVVIIVLLRWHFADEPVARDWPSTLRDNHNHEPVFNDNDVDILSETTNNAASSTTVASNDDGRDYYANVRQPKLETTAFSDFVWLASHPFSGSHLTRKVVEAATHRPTYSIYNEDGLHGKHLPGLDLPIRTSAQIEEYLAHNTRFDSYEPRRKCESLVVKTHMPYSPSVARRTPLAALSALFKTNYVARHDDYCVVFVS